MHGGRAGQGGDSRHEAGPWGSNRGQERNEGPRGLLLLASFEY